MRAKVKIKISCISRMVPIIIGFAVFTSYSGQWEVFTNKNDVRDIALTGNTLWAATTGGVVAWNLSDNSYKSYTTTDGLISCNINQVAIDKKGRPWVATEDPAGLFVYENHAWKKINVGGAEIADLRISGLEVDKFGNVWVNTGREYLWRYDGQAWFRYDNVLGPIALDLQKNLLAVDASFHNHSALTSSFKIVSFNGSEFVSKWRSKVYYLEIYLVHIAQDSKGNLWNSYCDDRYRVAYGVVCNDTLYTTMDGLADNNVRSITADESGPVWCATDSGISKFTGVDWVNYDTTRGVASNVVHKILIGSDNTLYAATSKGISILRSNQWKTLFLKTGNEPSGNNYTDIAIDKRGAVIFAGGDHIAVYNDLQWGETCFQNIRVGGGSYFSYYRNYNCKSFIKSKDGTLYVLGSGSGSGIGKGYILKQGTDGNTFNELFSHTTEKYDRIMSPAVASSGNDSCFWLTSRGGDLILLNKRTADIFPPSRFGLGLNFNERSNLEITCMLLDPDRRGVWIGYRSDRYNFGAIVHFDGDTAQRIAENDGPVSDEITAIARDSSKNLWFASSGGVAVLRNSDVQKLTFCDSSLCTHNTKLTRYIRDSDGKLLGGCNALFVDKSGTVWTHADNGIARFDGSSWKLFESSAVSPDLPYKGYSHMIQDNSGTLWFGTSGSGLLAYKENRWFQFTQRDGIPHNSIRSLALDRKDNLWVLTDKGIAMRKSDETVHKQARRDFLKSGNQVIKQHGSRFYVSSKDKPDEIRYTIFMFDLRGRVIHRQTIHRRKSFEIPVERFGSGLRILSITTKDNNGTQNNYLLKIGDINK